MEIFKRVRVVDKIVTPKGYLVTSLESRTNEEIRPTLGGIVAGLLYEEGVDIPADSIISRDIVTRVGPFEIKRTHLGKRPLFCSINR